MLAWRRPAVERCRCGTDLRTVTAQPASAELLAMNTLIYRAAGLSLEAASDFNLSDYRFPAEVERLPLGPLLRLIRSLGLLGDGDKLQRKQRPFHRTDLIVAIEADQAATAALRDWPQSWCKALSGMLPDKIENAGAPSLSDSFGNLYRFLFYTLPRSEFGFLHEGFETFVVKHWKGVVRRHQTLSAAAREQSTWIPAQRAAKKARINIPRLL